jgi:hypothetical protein
MHDLVLNISRSVVDFSVSANAEILSLGIIT